MRTLGIETSTRRGSVALVEGANIIVTLMYEEANAHAERMLPLVEKALAQAGWARSQLDRVGVGVGPGSFTGVRVGIALAQGIALGLRVPVVGVTTLAAMAAAAPSSLTGLRQPLIDARRNELFVGCYGIEGDEILPPRVVARSTIAVDEANTEGESGRVLYLGEPCEDLRIRCAYRSVETDLPHAAHVGLLAARQPTQELVEPLYVREADAVKPREAPDALVRRLGMTSASDDPSTWSELHGRDGT